MALGDYHAALTGAPGVAGAVRVAHLHGKGRALLAARAFDAGALLFVETPLAAMQHSRNAALVRACAHCLRSIGSLEESLERVSRARLSEELRALMPARIAARRQAAP